MPWSPVFEQAFRNIAHKRNLGAAVSTSGQITGEAVEVPRIDGTTLPLVQRVPAGGALSPFLLLPQQATVPSVFTPQVWENPALTWVKAPAGTVLSPELLLLQQTTDPPTLTPQL
jgi:hypothetical protein